MVWLMWKTSTRNGATYSKYDNGMPPSGSDGAEKHEGKRQIEESLAQ